MSSRRLTVVQLLPALHAGGVERSTLEIADALVRAGHRAVVVSAGGRLVPQLEAAGAEHVALDIGRKSPLTFLLARRLRALFAECGADIVHARSRLPAWVGHVALRGMPAAARPRFVTTVHGLNSPSRYSAIMTRGERVICVSDTVRDYVLRHYPATDPAKLRTIPRGIDPAAFSPAPWPDRTARARVTALHPVLSGDGPLLLLPGRGTRLKGHADALALLASLRDDGLDARLWMPGAREPGREARHRRGLRRQRPRAAGVAQARGLRAHRDRGVVGGSPGRGLGAWRRGRAAARTAAGRRSRAVRWQRPPPRRPRTAAADRKRRGHFRYDAGAAATLFARCHAGRHARHLS
jgi:glycosyltransferase involved in cell wall biosynthesis